MGKVIQFIELCGKQKNNTIQRKLCRFVKQLWNHVHLVYQQRKKHQVPNAAPTTDNIYYHTKSYICTLTRASIVDASERKSVQNFGILSNSIIIGTTFEITNETLTYINSQITTPIVDLTTIDDNPSQDAAADSPKWLKCGNISLTQRDRSILMNGCKLTDNHIDAAQQLLQAQFNQIKGLQSPLFQNTRRLQQQRDVLQILHIDKWHWAVISTFGETNPDHVTYYDSMFSFLSLNTQSTIINLLQPKSSQLHVKIMGAPIQSGSTDCGLFAIAISTALALLIRPKS